MGAESLAFQNPHFNESSYIDIFKLYDEFKEDVSQISRLKTRDIWYYLRLESERNENVYKFLNRWVIYAINFSLYGKDLFERQKVGIVECKDLQEALVYSGKIFFILNKIITDIPPKDKFLLLFLATMELNNGLMYPASHVLASRALKLLNIISKDYQPRSPWGRINYRLYRLILNMLSSKFRKVKNMTEYLLSDVKEYYEEKNEDFGFERTEVYEILTVLNLIALIKSISEYIITGNERLLRDIEKYTDRISKLRVVIRRPDLKYILDKIILAKHGFLALSIWNIFHKLLTLAKDCSIEVQNYLKEYINRKITNKYYFLYPSQYQAIKSGLLNPKNKRIVITMPTGSGKTFLAELIIVFSLLSDAMRSAVIYMVPSRALAYEKYVYFKEALEPLRANVCQITGEVTFEPEELLKNNNVIIVTPEKFDMLLRKEFYGVKIGTLIVDEFHNISQGHRGLRIQANILRFAKMFPQSQIVLLSAIAPNIEDIREWLDMDLLINIDWRPTFHRRGKARLVGYKVSIQFDDGEYVEIELPSRRRYERGYKRIVAFLAINFAYYGQCMVFCPTQKDVMDYAECLLEEIKRDSNYMELLGRIKRRKQHKFEMYLKKLERILGDEKYIVECFKYGVGVHWGSLPHIIRRIIENAVRENLIRIIVSTSTLAEGVNLPIKTIIIPRPRVGKSHLGLNLFFNILGRAGRPYREVEGQIIIYKAPDISEKEIDKYYSAKHNDIEPIISPIVNIASSPVMYPDGGKDISRNDLDREVMIATLDTVILAMLQEKILGENRSELAIIDRMIDMFLIGCRTEGRGNIRDKLKVIILESLQRLREFNVVDKHYLITKFGRVVYDTGFSPQSCVYILEQIGKNRRILENLEFPPTSTEARKIFFKLLDIMANTIEAKSYKIVDHQKHYNLTNLWNAIIDWMRGVPLEQIAAKYFNGKMTEAMLTIQGVLSSFVAWFFYALAQLVKYRYPNMNNIYQLLMNLAKYSWYGTTNDIAIRIMRKDISRELMRDDILAVVKSLDRNAIEEIMRNPDLIHKEKISEKIRAKVRYMDINDFISTLIRILSS